ncbi:SDR family NAD(P)-dependent oxidoreductase [Streptomyces sp. Da 82-17]|uniref:SDR family NAD(P)-dependent oxidoreductase n=1 Tax=Streptomyces sp. Da 82-17 TaxID=3377116 RepID=UPI0038D3E0FC
MPVAIVTGASKGLGRALATALAARGWDLVLDARSAGPLADTARELEKGPAEQELPEQERPEQERPESGHAKKRHARVRAVSGDVTDAAHRSALVAAARDLGGLDLLVHNASALGAEPLVRLEELPLDGLRQALETNVVAALGLVREALPLLRESAGAVLAVSSDAAVEAYETWGGYGASKAALDHLSAVLAVEEPGLRVWAVDPGDMRTELYRAAVPSDDDSGRPLPESVVPAFLRLLDERPASGRYVASELGAEQGAEL